MSFAHFVSKVRTYQKVWRCRLSLFELFFNNVVMERIRTCTLAYAWSKKSQKKKRYDLFAKQVLTKMVLIAFVGALILLGIHHVSNHRKVYRELK